MAHLTLRPGKDKDLFHGYPWVFANQIAATEGEPQTGDVVTLATHSGAALGRGFYHATSRIAFRFLTRDLDVSIDGAFWQGRLAQALALRAHLFDPQTHYRLVYSESDGFPGTLIDRYDQVYTFTTLCAGMDQRRDEILDALDSLVRPAAVVERNDHPLRARDELPERQGLLRGTYAGSVQIQEAGVLYEVDVLHGLKTGFFLDQREHRQWVRRLAWDKRVLDVFCADGGFGLQAAAGRAKSVHFVDSSAAVLERAAHNATLSGLAGDHLHFERADALEYLGDLVTEHQRYDLIILDPPAFAKSRMHVEDALRAYQRINISALQLLAPGGILATGSCSQAVEEAEFYRLLRYCARKANVRLRWLHRGYHPPDHPVLEQMPETHYLKFAIVQVLPDDFLPGRPGG
ncbi:MAG: class I SAM-dependent rRNA methyltransferase [Gloeomargaritaceae cyanobacterium C42_A2020_066]|nr:class I SAM-dependent rRNA methyltransferase [Gloeomargaritaceae cyanobacterium C42_A2020_066]